MPDAENYYCAALDNAVLKARAVSQRHPASIVIGADTLVELGKEALGKPASLDSARRMLRSLSGKTHFVATGVAVICEELDLIVKFTERTGVTFRNLSDADIEKYLSLVPVLDKAGAYAIQEHPEIIIDSISGSETNVIGLPAERLAETLRHVMSINP